MTDLPAVLRTCGNRGYRASQFEAGILAGKIYLSAYAQQLGASGSTFFVNGNTRKEKEVVEEYRYKKRKEIEKTQQQMVND
jgi:hypothetical protein